MTVTVEYAGEHLDELLDAMDGGGSVEILRPDKPIMRLSGAMLPVAGGEVSGRRKLGAGRGEMRVPDDEEWKAIDREWRKSFDDKFGSA